MRGDQLARQWEIIRAVEASPNELTVAEIATIDGAQGLHRREALQKPIPITGVGFFVMRDRSQ